MVDRRRDLKNAQANLNEAVRDLLKARPYFTPRELVAAFEEFERVAADFDAAGGAGKRQTSVIAAVTTLPEKRSCRMGIIQTLVAHYQMHHAGMTISELKARLRKEHQTVSSALNYVENAGWVRDSGERRLTNHRKPAIVWVPTDKAIAAVRDSSLGAA